MKRMVIALLVLVGLLVAADFGAAAFAESAVSRQMREQLGLADDPAVRINGFPFLTQAAAGHYRSVDVSAQRIGVGQLRELEVRAQLRDVTAPLSQLLGSGPRTIAVGEADGTVRIGPRDLERLIPGVDKLRIENVDADALEKAVADGADPSLADVDPDTAARLVGTSTVLGQEFEVWVLAVLRITDGQAEIVPRDVRLGADGPSLPSFAQRALRSLFTVRVDPGRLPLSVTPTELKAVTGSLEISGETADLVLGAGGGVAGTAGG
ncbi:MAG: LmeA family phospholipid-binding protein [Pseudonocardia sp.]